MNRLILLVFVLAVFAPSTFASVFYGQLDLGGAQYDDADDISVSYGAKLGALVFDSQTIQLFVEGGYKDLGKMKRDDLGTSNVSIKSYNLGGKVSMLDIGNVEVFGALGVHYWESRTNLFSDDGSDIYWGVSVEAPLTDVVDVGVGYNNFTVSKDSVSQLELKILYKF